MYSISDKVGGRFSETYVQLLKIANAHVEAKTHERVWRMVEMDTLHMEAHKMDMMKDMFIRQRDKRLSTGA